MDDKLLVFPKSTQDKASNGLYYILNQAVEDKSSLVNICMITDVLAVEINKKVDIENPLELMIANRTAKYDVNILDVGFYYLLHGIFYEFNPEPVLSVKNDKILEAAKDIYYKLEDWLAFGDLIGTNYFWQKPEGYLPTNPKGKSDQAFITLRQEGIKMELIRQEINIGEHKYYNTYMIRINEIEKSLSNNII